MPWSVVPFCFGTRMNRWIEMSCRDTKLKATHFICSTETCEPRGSRSLDLEPLPGSQRQGCWCNVTPRRAGDTLQDTGSNEERKERDGGDGGDDREGSVPLKNSQQVSRKEGKAIPPGEEFWKQPNLVMDQRINIQRPAEKPHNSIYLQSLYVRKSFYAGLNSAGKHNFRNSRVGSNWTTAALFRSSSGRSPSEHWLLFCVPPGRLRGRSVITNAQGCAKQNKTKKKKKEPTLGSKLGEADESNLEVYDV